MIWNYMQINTKRIECMLSQKGQLGKCSIIIVSLSLRETVYF